MISTFKHTGSVMVKKSIDTREVAERERERLAGRRLSLMGEFKARRLSVCVTHASFHIENKRAATKAQ